MKDRKVNRPLARSKLETTKENKQTNKQKIERSHDFRFRGMIQLFRYNGKYV